MNSHNFKAGDRVGRRDVTKTDIPAYKLMHGTVQEVRAHSVAVQWDCDRPDNPTWYHGPDMWIRPLTPWQDVDVWHYGGADGREDKAAGDERIAMLAEFKAHGVLFLGAFADPALYIGPDAVDVICDAGPDPWTIDWTGFPE